MTATCRSCGAPIWWATTHVNGSRIPVDLEPDATALLAVVDPDGNPVEPERVRGELEAGAVMGSAKGLPAAWPRWSSHFATCPDAGKWRRR